MRAPFAVALAALVLLSCACASSQVSAERMYDKGEMFLNLTQDKRDMKLDPTAEFTPACLCDIVDNPTAFLDINVEIRVRIQKQPQNRFEASYSGIRPQDCINFSVWPAGNKLWTEEGYVGAIDTLYVDKGNAKIDDFLALQKYQLATIRGKVVSDFNDEPWFLCYYVSGVSSAGYDDASLEGLVNGMSLLDQGDKPGAMKSFQVSADNGLLPDEALFQVHLELGKLYFERGRVRKSVKDYEKAIDNLNDALRLVKCPDTRKLYDQARTARDKQAQVDYQAELKRREAERRAREKAAK